MENKIETFENFSKNRIAVFENIISRVIENPEFYSVKKLRSCTATVYKTNRYTVLRSYSTFVAAYDCITNELIVRGYYSPTTQQHIAKFTHDFCPYALRVNCYINSNRTVMGIIKVDTKGNLYFRNENGKKEYCYR